MVLKYETDGHVCTITLDREKALNSFSRELIQEFADAGFLNIVGGCCGTVPAHIEAIADAVADIPPRTIPKLKPRCRLGKSVRRDVVD